MKIHFKQDKVWINHRPAILYGGEFQYFRIPIQLWKKSLKHLKEAGFNFLSFYIPWIWHEIEEGIFDFTGETLPERNLVKFLELCQKFKFHLIVRPGPYIYAEYQGFGVPEWLRRKYPDVLMKPDDNVFAQEIALNHPLFLEYVKSWFKSLPDDW